jgi:hypothetical protein
MFTISVFTHTAGRAPCRKTYAPPVACHGKSLQEFLPNPSFAVLDLGTWKSNFCTSIQALMPEVAKLA